MVDLRHLVDLNPKAGNSWQGLTRHQAKTVALVFIAIGLILADPPFSLIPTDIVNIFVAGKISAMTGYPLFKALVFTYTFLAWGFLFLGFWIYPHNTQSMINGTFNKIQKAAKKALQNPLLVFAGAFLFYIIYQWYSKILVIP
jgi:hypothetical protein